MAFQTYQPNIDNLQQYLSQENERNSNNYDGPYWWSIPSGMSSIRILPPWDPSGRVALPVYMHPIEFQSKSMKFKKYNWTCVSKTANKPCPICEGLDSIAATGASVDNWLANRRQFYFNAIVMHDPNYNAQKNEGTAPGTHVLLKAPKTFYDWVISQITNPMIGDITSVNNGIDVYVTKEGTGLGTTYSMTLSPNGRTAVPKEYLDKITDLYNLDEIFSTGFDKEQIDELVDHLKRSAGVLGSSVSSTVSQMAGYNPNAPQVMMKHPDNFANPNSAPNPFLNTGNSFSVPPQSSGPVQQQMFQPPTGSVNPLETPINPQPNTPKDGNLPKCYGGYDAGSVNCVVCPHEINCSQNR